MPRHFGKKFVPTSTITRRLDRVDLRFQAAARRTAAQQLGLQPETWPYASVAIVRADTPIRDDKQAPDDKPPAPIVGADAAAFHRFLADPATGPRLDQALAEFARIDAQLREDDRLEDERERESDGNTCSSSCNYCGRCS